MKKFNPGDTVSISRRFPYAYGDFLMDKVGIIYKEFNVEGLHYWVFFPELPGSGIEVGNDPITQTCYVIFGNQLELIK